MKSRKQSAANSPQPHSNRPVYFVDASLGRSVANSLAARGLNVIYHNDHFPEATEDETWLAEVGRQGWIALTKDSRIRYERNVRDAYIRAGARVFVLVGGNMTSDEMTAAFGGAAEEMVDLVSKRAGPFVANVSKSGRLTGTIHPPDPPTTS